MSADYDSFTMTTQDLRNKLSDLLKNKGHVGKLKSQLRNQLIVELKGVGLRQTFASGGDSSDDESLPLRAVNSLVADHLRQVNYDYSLSIFLPESGMTQDKLLTTKDLLQLLHVSPQSNLYTKLIEHSKSHLQGGFLWKLIVEIAGIHSRPTLDNGTQTEWSRLPSASIEEQFRKVDSFYSELSDSGVASRAAAVEERILAYQRLLEERSRSELHLAIARFKDNELSRLKIEGRDNSRKDMDKWRREMEQTYRVKYDALAERERHSAERQQKQQEMIEKENFAQRQTLLEEIESLKQREAQLRRQEETNNREMYLKEEKLKSLEELARRREDAARRAELEVEQRILTEINKFKVEEQARYLERIKNVEFREDKVKDCKNRVDDELQEIMNVKVELREKRTRVNELEAELIRIKQDLIGTQKQNEMFKERTREMADYQIMKEDNAVLRRELDNAKTRISELMRDVMVERQKHEDLLRELGHVASKPTSEVGLLRKQIEQFQNTIRTERALFDHSKLQMEQRLETEMDRNKQLLTKFQEQSWRQKEMHWETRDLRQQVIDRNQALGMKPVDIFSRAGSDSPCDLIDGGSKCHLPKLEDPLMYQDVVDTMLVFDSPRPTLHMSTENVANLSVSEDCSFSSDLVRDTKQRLKKIDYETERLEKWYQDCQIRAVSLTPILGEEPVTISRTREISSKKFEPVNKAAMTRTSAVPSSGVEYTNYVDKADNWKNSFAKQSGWEQNRDKGFEDSKTSISVTNEVLTDLKSKSKPASSEHLAALPAEELRTEKRAAGEDKNRLVTSTKEMPEQVVERFDKGDAAMGITDKEPLQTNESKELFVGSSDPLEFSLDDAWKPAQNSQNLEKEIRKEQSRRDADEAKFEEERRQRMEARKRQEEEAWQREQTALEELRKQRDFNAEQTKGNEKKEKQHLVEDSDANDLSETSKVSTIDPELLKYMAIVQKKRQEEKQQPRLVPSAEKPKDVEEESVVMSGEVSSNKSDTETDTQQASGDDMW